MADWTLIPCLVRLRAEFDDIAPGRGRESDGTVGDTAHAGGGVSDHLPDEDFPRLRDKDADSRNEVHAIDIDADLRTTGLSMEMVVQHLLGRCRSGAETRLRYIIYNRRIWEASNGWRQRAYTGDSPHTEHAHFSASYDSAREASTASWHLEEIPVALTADDKDWLADEIRKAAAAAVAEVFELGKQADGTPTSVAGAALTAHGVPNGVKPRGVPGPARPDGFTRDNLWEVLRDLGVVLVRVQQDVDLAKAAGPEVTRLRGELAAVAADVRELLGKHAPAGS